MEIMEKNTILLVEKWVTQEKKHIMGEAYCQAALMRSGVGCSALVLKKKMNHNFGSCQAQK